MQAEAILVIRVSYDHKQTGAAEIENTLDGIFQNALSTDGILDAIPSATVGAIELVATNVVLVERASERLMGSEFCHAFGVPHDAEPVEAQQVEDYAVMVQIIEQAGEV